MRLDPDRGYAAAVSAAASPERLFEALTSLEGLAGWWTPTVTGDPRAGGAVTFSFNDQRIVMRVDVADAPRTIEWTCLGHTKFPEWEATRLTFELRGSDPGSTVIEFRHNGLLPTCDCYGVCSFGWDHYLGSLASYAAGTGGSPWGTETWRPAPSRT
jgi:uncharacterized protein YndB with AHSA1/START domain